MTLTDSNPDLLHVARHSLAAASAVVAGNAVYVVERRRGPGRPTGASSGRYVRVDEDRLRELHADGLSDREIARRIGVSPAAALVARRRLGLDPNFDRSVRRVR